MTPITDFPRCTAYLGGMGIKVRDPEMQDKHFAWLLGDAAFSEKELVEMGAVGLDTPEWGALLPKMEAKFGTRKRRPKASKETRNELLGMICWTGIKGSTLKTDTDVNIVVHALWPELGTSPESTLQELLDLLQAKPKKWRSYFARENLYRVPPKYFGKGS